MSGRFTPANREVSSKDTGADAVLAYRRPSTGFPDLVHELLRGPPVRDHERVLTEGSHTPPEGIA
jgi:hypothetical protein